jgi:hypothetical protein
VASLQFSVLGNEGEGACSVFRADVAASRTGWMVLCRHARGGFGGNSSAHRVGGGRLGEVEGDGAGGAEHVGDLGLV